MHRFAITVMLGMTAVPISAEELADPANRAEYPSDHSLTLAEARASTAGKWRGELQYRDYGADRWFGIPVMLEVELIGDGVTLVRRAVFDDGPARGSVYITNVNMLGPDGETEFSGMYRSDRPAEHGSSRLVLESASDEANWTIVATSEGMDDNRPALIRETTIRKGDQITTLKQVDFADDDEAQWLDRNRTILTR